jgi:hypothetical protein
VTGASLQQTHELWTDLRPRLCATIATFNTADHTFGVCCYEIAWLPWAAADVPHFLWVHPTGLCYKLVMSRASYKSNCALATSYW